MQALLELSTGRLLDEFAAGAATPAAGSATALTAALAAALVRMVAALTVEKATAGSERLRERYGPYRARAEEIAAGAERLRESLQAMVQEDAELVEAMVRFRRQQQKQSAPSPEAVVVGRQATEAPLRTARAALQVAEYAQELLDHGYRSAAGDAEVAARLALAAADAALAITSENLSDAGTDLEWLEPVRQEHRELTSRMADVQRVVHRPSALTPD